MQKNTLLVLVVSSVLFMAGCSSKSPDLSGEKSDQVDKKVAEAKSTTDRGSSDELYKAEMVEENGEAYTQMTIPVDGENIVVKIPVIYFDFDKYNLTAAMQDKVKDFAEFAKENKISGKTFHIGGHCDEWGADEYNIALGLKRAKTVEKALQSYGVDSKFTLTSYGESKPVCTEHNTRCWKLNRRAETKILP